MLSAHRPSPFGVTSLLATALAITGSQYSTLRFRVKAPQISHIVDCHEYNTYLGGEFYICGDNIDEITAVFYLKPRTGGGADVPLTIVGPRTPDYVRLRVPMTTPTGIVYDVYATSRNGNSNLCTGNFHPGTGGKAWSYIGLTVNAFTTGSTADDPFNCQQWWGLNNGGKKLGNPLNVVNMQNGKFSTDGGVTWSGGTIGGQWSSGETLMNGATNTVWSLTFGGTGSSQLKMDINGVTYTSTDAFDTSTLSAENLLATIKSLANGTRLPFANRTDPYTRTASTAQLSVSGSGTGPYTITLLDGWAGVLPRTAGAAAAFTIASGTSTITVNTLTTAGTATDWTKNFLACITYINTNWSGSGYGVVWAPAGYYLIDTFGSHAGKDGTANYTLNLTNLAHISLKGDGKQQTVFVVNGQWDDRDAGHTPGTSDALFLLSGNVDGFSISDMTIKSENASLSVPTPLWRVNGKITRYICFSNMAHSGPGMIGSQLVDPQVTGSYCHVYRNSTFTNNSLYTTQSFIEGNTNGQGFRNKCFDHLTVDGCDFTYRKLRWYLAQQCNTFCITRTKFRLNNPYARVYPVASVESGGIELSFAVNGLCAMNDIENVQGMTIGFGQMEALMTQQGALQSTYYSVQGVTSNSGTTLVCSAQIYAGAQTPLGMGQASSVRSTDAGTTMEWGYMVKVMSGTGAGQWRWVIGVSTTTNTNDTLTLDKAFTTTLDATSKVSIFVPTNTRQWWCDNVVRGWLYITQYDGAIAHRCNRNRIYDSGAIVATSKIEQGVKKIAPLHDVTIDGNLFYSNGLFPTGPQVGYGFANAGTATITDTPSGSFAYNVAVTNNFVYTGGCNPNNSGFTGKQDDIAKLISVAGNFAGKTIADIEGGSPTVVFSGNYMNGVLTAVNTTTPAGTATTKPVYTYGTIRPTAATFAEVDGNPASVTDPTAAQRQTAVYVDPGSLLALPA